MTEVPEGVTVLPPFDSELVEGLMKTYGIKDRTSLISNLRLIQRGYASAKRVTENIPTTKESIRQIETMRSTAHRLRHQIEGDLRQSIVLEWLHMNLDGMDVLKSALDEFEQCVTDINPKGLKKRSDVISRDFLITRIAHLWQHYMSKSPSYSTARGKRGDNFINFMTDVAYILGVDPSPLPERFSRLKRKNPDL